MHDKIENVERVARMNEFKRLQTLRKIEGEYVNPPLSSIHPYHPRLYYRIALLTPFPVLLFLPILLLLITCPILCYYLVDNEERYESIQAQRKTLLEKRREEMKFSMLRKHEVSEIMDLMRITNDFTLLAKLSVKKAKPSTSMGGKGDKDEGEDDARLNQTA